MIRLLQRQFEVSVPKEDAWRLTGGKHDQGAGDIVTRPWGERSFYAADPFGNRLCFVDEQTIFTGR
jgi:hypothetical protein